ncbi:MAG: hypothetical protein AAB834_03225 [Patescibacteria group bacterium]
MQENGQDTLAADTDIILETLPGDILDLIGSAYDPNSNDSMQNALAHMRVKDFLLKAGSVQMALNATNHGLRLYPDRIELRDTATGAESSRELIDQRSGYIDGLASMASMGGLRRILTRRKLGVTRTAVKFAQKIQPVLTQQPDATVIPLHPPKP